VHLVRRWLLRWALVIGLWLVLAATWTTAEVVAAVVAGAVTATIWTHFARRGDDLLIRPRWLLDAVRLPMQVARDLVILMRALPSGDEGVFRAVPFDVRGMAPDDIGRRVMLTAASSLGPNTYVVAWDIERQLVLVHQLQRSPHVLPAEGGTRP
jgi:hypothetical protein